MVKYWLLSYPRQNMEITISKNLIGGKTTNAYEHRFKNQLSIGDKLVLVATGERKIRGFAKITGEYKYDTTPVWPIIREETYPHRRSIEIEELFNGAKALDIADYYQELNMLKDARSRKVNLGMSFGMRIRGTTPKEIDKHDFNLLYSGRVKTEKTEISYFVLITGSKKYKDQPETLYHFKKGLLGLCSQIKEKEEMRLPNRLLTVSLISAELTQPLISSLM